METAIPKDLVKKVRKFIETAEALRSGQQTYFSITKLTSIKSLCENPQTASRFVFYLAERTMEKATSNPCPDHLNEEVWEKCKNLISSAVHAMREHFTNPTENTLASLRELLPEVIAIQPHTGERIHGTIVRTIYSRDVLIIEDALLCLLNPIAAPELAYKAARGYAEEYNSRYGTGLIPESVPMLEDIIDFWCNYIQELQQQGHSLGTSSQGATKRSPKRQGSPGRRSSNKTGKSRGITELFEKKYPNLTTWMRHGWIEVGTPQWGRSFIRVFDEGGMIWEGKSKYKSLDDAFADAEEAVAAWRHKNG